MAQPHRPSPRRRTRRKKHFPWLFAMIVAVTLLLVFSLIQYGSDLRQSSADVPSTEANSRASDGDTITIAVAGDIGISPELLSSAEQPDGSYDFSQILLGVSPLLTDADLTVADLELNIMSGSYTGEDYRAPESLLTALSAAGVDLLQTANTASIYNGLTGLTETYNAITRAGLQAVGTFPTAADFKRSGGFTLVEAAGFRVAFVGFTKGMGSLRLPDGAEDCVNLLYTDYDTIYQKVDTEGILQILENVAAAQPDITIALVHWGSEYDTDISKTQETIRELLLDHGVDAIFGTHSHIAGVIDDESRPGTLTAYSLGNLLTSGDTASARQGLVLKLEFTRQEGTAVLSGWEYAPIYCATAEEAGTPQVLDIDSTVGLYESAYINRISQPLYDALIAAREKIAQRVQPEQE